MKCQGPKDVKPAVDTHSFGITALPGPRQKLFNGALMRRAECQSIQWTEEALGPRSYELSFPFPHDSYWLNRVEVDGGYGWVCQLQEEYTVDYGIYRLIDQLITGGGTTS